MKLTNAVPQDSIFNQNQWSAAETLLKETAVFDCQNHGYLPIIFTGAVPFYDIEHGAEKELKIGQKIKSKVHAWASPVEKQANMIAKVTIPSHMWTAMFCYKTPTTEEEEEAKKDPTQQQFPGSIISFISYIGLNIQTGKVKWYSNPTTFQNILSKMYFGAPDSDSGAPTTKFFPANLDSLIAQEPGRPGVVELVNKAIKKKEDKKKKEVGSGVMTMLEGPSSTDNPSDETWWDDVAQSITNRRKQITEEMRDVYISKLNTLIATVEVLGKKRRASGQAGAQRKRQNRRPKRDVELHTSVLETNATFSLIKLVDSSTTSDITISQCTIKETYAGGEEEHIISFEKNLLIGDPNTANGAEIDANITRNGVEVELEEKVSSMTRLSITLVPRHPAPQEEEEAGGGG